MASMQLPTKPSPRSMTGGFSCARPPRDPARRDHKVAKSRPRCAQTDVAAPPAARPLPARRVAVGPTAHPAARRVLHGPADRPPSEFPRRRETIPRRRCSAASSRSAGRLPPLPGLQGCTGRSTSDARMRPPRRSTAPGRPPSPRRLLFRKALADSPWCAMRPVVFHPESQCERGGDSPPTGRRRSIALARPSIESCAPRSRAESFHRRSPAGDERLAEKARDALAKTAGNPRRLIRPRFAPAECHETAQSRRPTDAKARRMSCRQACRIALGNAVRNRVAVAIAHQSVVSTIAATPGACHTAAEARRYGNRHVVGTHRSANRRPCRARHPALTLQYTAPLPRRTPSAMKTLAAGVLLLVQAGKCRRSSARSHALRAHVSQAHGQTANTNAPFRRYGDLGRR